MSRFLIQILPAATVAPLFFQGKIEFGVINQSSSAFNHILTDVSLVVYQVQAACFGVSDKLCALCIWHILVVALLLAWCILQSCGHEHSRKAQLCGSNECKVCWWGSWHAAAS